MSISGSAVLSPREAGVFSRAASKHEGSRLSLFLASFLALYFELVVIRYLGTEIRAFAYLMNLLLVAAFAGIGFGMILEHPLQKLRKMFPVLAAGFFLIIAYAEPLHLTHVPFPTADYAVFGDYSLYGWAALARFFSIMFAVLVLVFAFFVVLGGLVGQEFARHAALPAYCINLAGSLAGVTAFTLASFLGLPPAAWLLLGAAAGVQYYYRRIDVIILFIVVIVAVAGANRGATWSPYYHISIKALAGQHDREAPSAYFVNVNHDYHQKMVDLSPDFLREHPTAEPNRSARSTYELPYLIVPQPGSVLVIGAGTGNDVAAALRHGATHVDAVEIDPMIYRLGRQYHPEHPYSSDRVTVFIDDARAFLKKTHGRYDLIVFAYLDAHTMISSFSSLRLDNYVYTVDSFREARSHLKQSGTLVLAFDSGTSFISRGLFSGLRQAFGADPRAYFTGYDSAGVVFVEGAGRDVPLSGFEDMTDELARDSKHALLVTDDWPFLYSPSRSIPSAILMLVLPFLVLSTYLIDINFGLTNFRRPEHLHMFLLGAGFMLLETSCVTRMSLLFGSTWVVNAVVIGAFVLMALLANLLVIVRVGTYGIGYAGLLLALLVNVFFDFRRLDALAMPAKVLGVIVLIGLPIFFSGVVFSRSLRDCDGAARALGINLLGAVIGGVAENVVMIAGTSVLPVLALTTYVLSAVALSKVASKTPASSTVRSSQPA